MNTANQNGKHINQAPKGYVVIYNSNGKVIRKAPPKPKKNLIQKILGL